jgi:hypothetical protein
VIELAVGCAVLGCREGAGTAVTGAGVGTPFGGLVSTPCPKVLVAMDANNRLSNAILTGKAGVVFILD